MAGDGGRPTVLVLGRDDVEALLDHDRLVDALARAFVELTRGTASVPPRTAAVVPEHDGWLGSMVAYLPSARAIGAKLVSVYPSNAQRGIETHQAVIALFDPATGVPIAILDGASITAARTAGASALATRLLARPDAAVLAVLGSGTQARAHVHAMLRLRQFRQVRIAARDAAKARGLAAELAELADRTGSEITAVAGFDEALRGADVVCAATHSPDPVVRHEWLMPGVHVNSVGYNTAGREVDAATVADALVVVESRAAALAPPPSGANDLTWPIRDGLIAAEHIHADLGELITGQRPGRTGGDQITLYKSVGVAVEDVAAAALVVEQAAKRGLGDRITL